MQSRLGWTWDHDQDLTLHQGRSRSRLVAAMTRSCCRPSCREPRHPDAPLTLPHFSSSCAGELRASLTLHISGFTDEVAMNSSSAQESAWHEKPALKIFTTVYWVSIIYNRENRHRWHSALHHKLVFCAIVRNGLVKFSFFSKSAVFPPGWIHKS